MNKVILISVDGMRPDGFLECGNPYIHELMKSSSYALDARTIFPSVTLPCHMSLFHSVPAERHGITTNTYMPMVRPFNGLFEQIAGAGGKSVMYYGWEPIRDVSRPLSLIASEYINSYSAADTDGILTDRMIKYLENNDMDFAFLYLVETDEKGGHDSGWMSETYLNYVNKAVSNIEKVIEKFGDKYTIIITADHGGHDRGHGSEMKEDMTIPIFFRGRDFEAGKALENVSILDIAPTIADVMQIPKAREWEGKSLIKN